MCIKTVIIIISNLQLPPLPSFATFSHSSYPLSFGLSSLLKGAEAGASLVNGHSFVLCLSFSLSGQALLLLPLTDQQGSGTVALALTVGIT